MLPPTALLPEPGKTPEAQGIPPTAQSPPGGWAAAEGAPPAGESPLPTGDRLARSEENRSNAAWAPPHRRRGHDVGEQTKRSAGAEERSQPPPPSLGCSSPGLVAGPRRLTFPLPQFSSVPGTTLPDEFPPPTPSTPGTQSPGRAHTNQSHAKARHQATNPRAREFLRPMEASQYPSTRDNWRHRKTNWEKAKDAAPIPGISRRGSSV